MRFVSILAFMMLAGAVSAEGPKTDYSDFTPIEDEDPGSFERAMEEAERGRSTASIEGVYRAYVVSSLIAVESGSSMGVVSNSSGRGVETPYFVVGISDNGGFSINGDPYRFEGADAPGHIKIWPADAEYRYQYPSLRWNVQPVIDGFVAIEYEILLQFNDGNARAASIYYLKEVVPGGRFSNRWIEQAESAIDEAEMLIDQFPWD